MLKVSIDAPPLDRTALFLDVDGTLLDLAASPTAVVVPRGLVECIADIERALGGALALVSGRTLANLDQLFLPLRLRASGVQRAEIRYDPLMPVIVDTAAAVLPARLWRSLNASLVDFPGAFAEDKRFSFAVHYRAAPNCSPGGFRSLSATTGPTRRVSQQSSSATARRIRSARSGPASAGYFLSRRWSAAGSPVRPRKWRAHERSSAKEFSRA